jgi:hypothetical protein
MQQSAYSRPFTVIQPGFGIEFSRNPGILSVLHAVNRYRLDEDYAEIR